MQVDANDHHWAGQGDDSRTGSAPSPASGPAPKSSGKNPLTGEVERLTRSFLDSLSSHIAIVDESGTIVAVNRAWRAYADSMDALMTTCEGANYFQACQNVQGKDADSAALLAAEIREVLNGRAGSPPVEYPCVSPEGTRWFASSVHRFKEDGPSRAVVIHDDVTRRKNLEQAYRQSESLFAQMFRHSPIGLALARIEPVGQFVMVNPSFARMLGYTEEELLAGSCHTVSEEGLVEQERAYFEALIRREISFYRMEKRYFHKSGQSLWGLLHVTLIDDESGAPAFLLGMVEDITERKQAEENLARSTERTKSLSRRLLRAQEDECRRIARELHDEMGQAPTSLRTNIREAITDRPRAGERLEESLAIVDECLRQVRGMAMDLRPSILDDLGLLVALLWYASRHAERNGLKYLVVTEPDEIHADPEIETACFRIAQEALTNVARHAEATRFVIELTQHSRGLQLIVRDDGIGFDPEAALQAGSRGASFGLVGMRERVELIGGRLSVISEPGKGTEVQVEFPNFPAGRGHSDD